ncbi:MAG: class I SAM-dependent methyltransferase [Magnetococcus sp. DMHC-8]
MTICGICANDRANRLHYPRELMFGWGESFEYLECGHCGCLQITRIPEDLARYYPQDYYAYHPPRVKRLPRLIQRLRALRTRHFLGESQLLGAFFALFSRRPEHFQWFERGRVTLETRILDVGCGTGRLLLKLEREGFRHVLGVDPYLQAEIRYDTGVTILKRQLAELAGPFDFIMLHHSFEHMPEPGETLNQLHRLLAPGGTLLLRIPVADCHAFRKYGVHWVAWDAPRHLYLHTVRSLHLLAQQCGFEMFDVSYDSTLSQFVTSELYLRGITCQDMPSRYAGGPKAAFTRQEWRHFARAAAELNRQRDGDTACFYLRATGSTHNNHPPPDPDR